MPPFEFDVINYWSELKLDIIKDYTRGVFDNDGETIIVPRSFLHRCIRWRGMHILKPR